MRVRISDGTTESPGEPSTEFALHLATYRARPDVTSVVHLHPQALVLLDAIGGQVRLVTTDHVYYLRRVVTAPFAFPGSVELAHKRVRYLEEAALLTYRALALPGRPELRECPPAFSDHIEGSTSVKV